MAENALQRAFPELRSTLPRHAFVSAPTPVAPLPLAGFGEGQLFVKRDDACCPLYGGNKPRKLEFIIGAARARGSRRLVTAGGLGTHHGLATAILGRAADLRASVVLIDQPQSDEARRTLLLQQAFGAELVWGRDVAGAALQVTRLLARAALQGERPFLVAPGGSSPRGCAGFVAAGLELAAQVRAGVLPRPAEIWLPVGTGGTFAGLVVGLRLAGLETRVRGVLVTDVLPPRPPALHRRARALLRFLARLGAKLPRVRFEPQDFALVHGWLGAGYGAPTAAGRVALEVAAQHGLALDASYTAKCLAALIDHARRGRLPRQPVVFWNTFNSVDAAARAPRPPAAGSLPPRLRARFGADQESMRSTSTRVSRST